MHHESPNPNRGLPRGAAGEAGLPKLATILSSESSNNWQKRRKEYCDSNTESGIHFIWKRHLFTFSFGSFDSEITKSLPWGGASLFSWNGDRPLLVSVNCDVLKNCSVLNCDWNTLREMWTAKILYTHVHILHIINLKMSIEDIKSLIWPNDIN